MGRFLQGVVHLFGSRRSAEAEETTTVTEIEKIIISEDQLEGILPHRGRMLLLNQVVITPTKVMGQFLVTQEVCDGHGVFGGTPVFKGSDLLDMSAQLLGVWAAQSDTFRGKLAVVREYGQAKFQNPIHPGDPLELTVEPNKLEGKVAIKGGREFSTVSGKDFIASVNGQRKAVVGLVKLAVLSPNDGTQKPPAEAEPSP